MFRRTLGNITIELELHHMIADDLRINSDLESKLSHSQAPDNNCNQLARSTKDGIN